MPLNRTTLILCLIFAFGCSSYNPPKERNKPNGSGLPIEDLKLPEGFSIDVFASNVENARSLEWSPSGTLFVSTRGAGKVYALTDTDGDYRADNIHILAQGLNMPNGVAFRDGALYVAEVNRILKFPDIENNLENTPAPEVVYDQFPKESHHGWKYIDFGPDGKLYVPVGAPCNVCESDDEIFNTITRMNPDGTDLEIVHTGIRNTVGFTWHPETKELWFTDNGRDWLGDDSPACELNYAPKDGMNFGFPYCHQGDVPDPDFGDKFPCSDFDPPAQKLGAHVAPLGLEFITSSKFPKGLKHQILIAEHGSWNRSTKSGYKISLIRLNGNEVVAYEDFITGWLDQAKDEAWGRPVDLEWLPDGSLLISDDFADAIYRVSYTKS